jgi:hypothetical protein
MSAFRSTPVIDEPDFRKGWKAASANGLSGSTAKFQLRHYPFRSHLFTPGGIA